VNGNINSNAWTTSGVRIKGVTGTITDLTSSGTVAAAYTNILAGDTIAANSSTTYTNYYATYLQDPIAGGSVTMTNKWALGVDSLKVNGNLSATGTVSSASKPWKCVVAIGDPGAAQTALADDDDAPVACSNDTGADVSITTVACWANAGAPTVTPILTGGTGTSVLTGALTCGTAAWAAGAVQGTPPVLHTFSGTGATCSVTPCTIDDNITTAGGTAKYLVIKITGTYTGL